MKITCIYQGNCAEGFTAAWIVNKYFKDKTDDIEFIVGKYKPLYDIEFISEKEEDEPPYDKLKGRELYMVNFLYPLEVMKKLNKVCTKITVFDNHKTAEPIMKELDFVDKVLDMDKSGALITWEQLFPGEKIPDLVRYVSDRYLLKFELPKSKEVSMFLFPFEYTFKNWDEINNNFDIYFDKYI